VRLAFALAALLVPAIVRADTEACVAASDAGQKLRDEGHLRAAREKLTTCAAEECPSPVRGDCVRWLDDVDKRTPSIVIAATASGKDATDVRVSIDGAPVAAHLDGNAILLDPGEHKVRYEHAGDPPQEEAIVLREGEKDRALRVAFGKPPVLTPPKGPPTLAYTMTGVALGAGLGWGAFALTSFLVVQNYDSCKSAPPSGGCNVDGHQTVSLTTAVLADVSLGVALIAAGIAIWAYVKHGHKPAPTSAVTFDLGRAALLF
jgi:hypothetical protein